MSLAEGQLTPSKVWFSGFQTTFQEARYVVFGVPFDATSTYRRGSRLGPRSIREASLNIETYSPRIGLDVEDLKICDLGDIETTGGLKATLRRVGEVISEILKAGKIPVALGGEHTLTLGVGERLPSGSAVISFDAHFDLRSEYQGKRYSHTTFLRRLAEILGPSRIMHLGARAYCKEELNFAREGGLAWIGARDVASKPPEETAGAIANFLKPFDMFYLTLDMDVVDPAYAPGVGNPEPEGLSPTLLLDIIGAVCDGRLLGFDVVEVAPKYDLGVTSVLAAKIIFETLCDLENKTKGLEPTP